jgi:CRP-like cAMP-binding protein
MVDELLLDIPALDGLGPEHRDLIAGCARNRVIRSGDFLLREGDTAAVFHVLRRGAVAIEAYAPPHGSQIIETLRDGELIGWSWLFPPYRASFDVRALEDAHVIEFDGECLRGKLDDDSVLAAVLYRVFAGVMLQRLQATRVRLLDVYGS